MNRLKQSLLFGCLFLMLPGLMAAENVTTVPTTISGAPDATQAVGGDLDIRVNDGKLDLSLEQAIGLALRRNLTLVVQRFQRTQSILAIDQNTGIYDINLSGNGGASEDTLPTTSALQATGGGALTQEGQQINLRATRMTPLGGTFQIDFANSRSVSSNANDTLNPSLNVGLDFTFTQPLWRNYGREVTERNLIVARTNAAISREDFQSQVETIIQQASDSYWNLVESIEQLAVAQESLTLAEKLHQMNQVQVEVGTKAPLEVVSSQARVATRKQEIIRFRAQVENNADELRRLANLDRGQLWNVAIVPTTKAEVAHQPIDFEQAVETALDRRLDVRRRHLLNENLELDARVARKQKQPAFNVSATYGTNAAEGNAFMIIRDDLGNPTAIPIGNTGYDDALGTIASADFEGWRLGFDFAFPIGNREAKARSATADLARDQGLYELRDLELQVLAEVRRAARDVETAAEEIESAKVSSHLQGRNLDAEQKRYENGLSTSFQVLEIQEDLSEAKRAEVSAIIGYQRAEVAFHRAVGELLEQFDVALSEELETE